MDMKFTSVGKTVIKAPAIGPRVLGYSMFESVKSSGKCGSCGK